MPDEQRIGIVIEGQDRLSPELRKVAQGFRMTEQEYRKFLASLSPQKMKEMSAVTGQSADQLGKWAAGAKEATAQAARFRGEAQQTTQQVSKLGSIVQAAGVLLVSHLGAQRMSSITGGFIKTRSEFAKMEVQLQAMMGDAQAAANRFDELKRMAKETPISLREWMQALNTMTALRVQGDGVTKTLLAIGNAAARTGDDMDMYLRHLQRLKMRQYEMSEMGRTFPLEDLTKYGVQYKQTSQGVTITNKEVLYRAGLAYIYNLPDALGAQAKTIGGQLNNLGDDFDLFNNDVGKSMEGAVGHVIGFKSAVLQYLSASSPTTKAVIGLGAEFVKTGLQIAEFAGPVLIMVAALKNAKSAANLATAAVGTAGLAGAAGVAAGKVGGLTTALQGLKLLGAIAIPITITILGYEGWLEVQAAIERERKRRAARVPPGGEDIFKYGPPLTSFGAGPPRTWKAPVAPTTKGVHPAALIEPLTAAWKKEFWTDYYPKMVEFLQGLPGGEKKGLAVSPSLIKAGAHRRFKKADVSIRGTTTWAELEAAAEYAGFHVSREVTPAERSRGATGAHLDLAVLTAGGKAAMQWQEGAAKDTQTATDKARKEGEKAREEQAAHLERLTQARREWQKSLMEPMQAAIADLNDQARKWKQQGRPKGEQRAAYDAEFERIRQQFGQDVISVVTPPMIAGLLGFAQIAALAMQQMLLNPPAGDILDELASRRARQPSTPGGLSRGVPSMQDLEELEFRGRRERWSPEQRNLAIAEERLRQAREAKDPKEIAANEEWILMLEADIDAKKRSVQADERYADEVQRFTDRLVNLLLDPSGKGFADFFGSLAKTMQAGWIEQAISPYVGRFMPATGGAAGGGTKAITDALGTLPKVGPPSDPKSQAKAVKEGTQAAAGAMGVGIPGRTLSRGSATTFAAIGVAASMTGSDVVQSAVGMGMAGFQVAGWPGAIAGLALGAILGSRAKKKANEQAKARQWLNAPEEFEIQAYLYNLGRMGYPKTTWGGMGTRDPLLRVDTVNINVNGSGDPAATARAVTAELQALTMSAGAYGGEYD